MRISDWSSDVCSSDLTTGDSIAKARRVDDVNRGERSAGTRIVAFAYVVRDVAFEDRSVEPYGVLSDVIKRVSGHVRAGSCSRCIEEHTRLHLVNRGVCGRSEEHTSELQSLMRISYAVFCLKKKKKKNTKQKEEKIQDNTRG